MHRVFVSISQPIRFVRFYGKSVNRGLEPVLDFPEVAIPGTDQKERSLWVREGHCSCNHYVNQGKTLHTCICQVTIEHGQLGHLKVIPLK